MRFTLLILTALIVTACKEPMAVTPKTAVDFWIEPSCNPGTQNLGLKLYVDGVYKTTAVLSPGEHSTAISVTPGFHEVSAQENYAGGYIWKFTVNVREGSTVSLSVGC